MQIKELTPKYAALAAIVESKLGARVQRLPTSTAELGYRVDAVNLLDVCTALRDTAELKFEILVDVCGVDYQAYGLDEWQTNSASSTGFSRGRTGGVPPDEEELEAVGYHPPRRFAAVYHLLSITHNHRLRLRAFCPSDERPILDSVYGIWNAADWYEREAFDLYGILFRGH